MQATFDFLRADRNVAARILGSAFQAYVAGRNIYIVAGNDIAEVGRQQGKRAVSCSQKQCVAGLGRHSSTAGYPAWQCVINT